MCDSCAMLDTSCSFIVSFQSVRRARRYSRSARSIGKVHSRLRQRPPDLCVAISYNHQAAIHHRSLCRVTRSPVCLLRLYFFPSTSGILRFPPSSFSTHQIWYFRRNGSFFGARHSFRRILFLSQVISRKQSSLFFDDSFLRCSM